MKLYSIEKLPFGRNCVRKPCTNLAIAWGSPDSSPQNQSVRTVRDETPASRAIAASASPLAPLRRAQAGAVG